MQIVLETEEPENPRSLFRVSVDGKMVADALNAAQAHLVVGDALEDFVAPGRSPRRMGDKETVRRPGDERSR